MLTPILKKLTPSLKQISFKVAGGLKFAIANFTDVATKLTAWTKAEDTSRVHDMALALYNKGVLESDLSSAEHDLGDNLAAVRMTYTIFDRWHL